MKKKIHFEERPCLHIDGTADESIKRLVLVAEDGEVLLYDILDMDESYANRLELMKLVLTHAYQNYCDMRDTHDFHRAEDLTRLAYVKNFTRLYPSSLVNFSHMLIVEDFYYGYKYYLGIMGEVLVGEDGMSDSVKSKLATHLALGKLMFDKSGSDKAALMKVFDGVQEDDVFFGDINLDMCCYE